MNETVNKKETRLYKVRDKVTGDVIYVEGTHRNQVQSFASYNRFETTLLTVKEAIGLKASDILDATSQPGPPGQLDETEELPPPPPDPVGQEPGIGEPAPEGQAQLALGAEGNVHPLEPQQVAEAVG